jgi:anaerobic magnesium-protoporphyrin IX monomethyl ester cyclase
MNKKGKVLFIIHDVYQDDNGFPIGIAYMSAILKRKGVDVRVCCQDVFHYSNEELAEKFLKDEEYDLIGFGFLAARFKETVLGLAEIVNKYKKNAWFLLGGHGPSPIPEFVIKKTDADIVVIGEAEETIVELLDCKIGGGDLSKINGIAYKKDGKVLITKRRRPVIKLDEIPFPEWSLFPMESYTNCMHFYDSEKDERSLGILTSRGCINRCNFCYRMEGGIRFRSIDNVIQEIKLLNEKYGVTYFPMFDELFNYPKARILEWLKAVKKNNLKIKFTCNARVDIFDEESAIWLKESGCRLLNFGFESSNQKVLDLMGKHATVEQNIRALEIARKVGIAMGLNFIWGNKGDTAESLRSNVEMIKKYNTYYQVRTIRPVTPYPGCDLYYEAVKMGLLSGPEDFFNKFKNSDLLLVNFTDIPEDKFYKLLFEANKELILDHYEHTTKNTEEANNLVQNFYNLYFKGETKFRGARHYEKK